MSSYLPRSAVLREIEMQVKRRNYGLKVGTYITYPSADIQPNFVIKKSRLYAEDDTVHEKGAKIILQYDNYIAMIEKHKAKLKATKEQK